MPIVPFVIGAAIGASALIALARRGAQRANDSRKAARK